MIPCLHGGIVASLIDHVGGFTCWSSLYTPFQRVSTVDLRVDYLRPAPCEDLWFEAQVLHATKKYIRSDVVCWNADRSKKLAIGRCLFNIYEGKEDLSKLIKVEKN